MEVYKVNENDGTLRVCVVTVASIPIEDCENQRFYLCSIDNTASKLLLNHMCSDRDIFNDILQRVVKNLDLWILSWMVV